MTPPNAAPKTNTVRTPDTHRLITGGDKVRAFRGARGIEWKRRNMNTAESGDVVHVCLFEIREENQTEIARLEALGHDKSEIINKAVRSYFAAIRCIAIQHGVDSADVVRLSLAGEL